MATDPHVAPDALGQLRFHHLGFVTNSCAREAEAPALLGYAPEGKIFADPAQGIRGQFLVGGGPRIELLGRCRVRRHLTLGCARG